MTSMWICVCTQLAVLTWNATTEFTLLRSRFQIWSEFDPNSSSIFSLWTLRWNEGIAPMVHCTSTLDSKWIDGNYQLTTFLYVLVSMKSQSYLRSYTEKSFNLLLKRTDWIAFKLKFKGIRMYTGEWRRWEVIDFNFLTRKLTKNRFFNLQWIKRENIRP